MISKDTPKSTKYTDEFFPQNFLSKSTYKLSSKKQSLNIEKILRTSLQQKLVKKQDDQEKHNKQFFTKIYTTKIKKLITEYKQRVHRKEKVRLDDIECLENDFVFVNKELFTDNILKDCYEFLESQYGSVRYLQFKYEEFMNRTMKKGGINGFINNRYGRDVFKMDVYENRCLYAELYLSIRIGNYSNVENILREYSFYFDGSVKGFHALMTEFVTGLVENRDPENMLTSQSKKQASFLLHMTNASTDKFKIILLKMMSQSFVTDNDPVIDTLEDFIFFILLTVDHKKRNSEIYKMFREFPNDSGKLFAYLLVGMNDEAIETMFEGNFSVYECYFLMQNLIRRDIENFKYYVYLVFLVAKNFKNTEKKMKIINALQKYNFIQKNQLIVDNIIKFRLFDIIHEQDIDKDIINILGEELKERNETDIILENHHIFNDERLLLDVYCNTVKDIIVNNKVCDNNYLDSFFSKFDTLNMDLGRKANILHDFFMFYKNRNEETFKRTMIVGNYTEEIDKELTLVVEKILLIACNVFRRENNRFCLEKILRFAGHYQFGNEILYAINNEVIDIL